MGKLLFDEETKKYSRRGSIKEYMILKIKFTDL